MIVTDVLLSQVGAPRAKYEAICRFIWEDESLIEAKELTENQAALIVCGSLVYRYAQPDIALMILKAISGLLDMSEDVVVVSVVDGLYLSFSGRCWDLSNGKLYDESLPPITAVESHALDIKKGVSILRDVSSARQSVREGPEHLAPGQRATPLGRLQPPAGVEPPCPGRQPWGMG